MAAKPCIPKGTRDFSPIEMAKRNYIFNTIRDVYHLYGFQQIETPAMEMLSTLMGKYGEEGDKLLFKIQNSGDYFSGLTDEDSSATRYSPYGVPTVRRRDATASSTSATPTWWAVTPCSTRWS